MVVPCVIVIAIVVTLSGCARSPAIVSSPPPPTVFEQTPDIQALAAAVNRTDAIRELSTNSAKLDVLSMTALPKLSATMHLRRDREFRLKASIPILMGSGLDLGSNDQTFWFEVPEGMSQTLYFADHASFANQLDRAILPVDPTWIIEAIGLARLDPQNVVAGPVTRTDGMIEVRSVLQSAAGPYQRVCFIEPSAGYITHLFLYSPRGQLVAKSHASEHRYYDEVNSVLPHRVKMELFPTTGPPLAMQVDVASYSVNQLLSGDPQLFAMPATRNRIDLLQIPTGSIASSGEMAGRGGSAWSIPTTGAGTPTEYSASTPTGPPLRGIRYE